MDKMADGVEPGLVKQFGLAADSFKKMQADAFNPMDMVRKLTDAGDIGSFG